MINLLSSCLFQMRKSVIFWVAEAATIVFGIWIAASMRIDMGTSQFTPVLDDGLFNDIVFMGILLAVFVTLFVGTEYSEGTIRNKVSAGHSRIHIYLSYLCVCCIAATIFYVSYIAAYLIVGIPLLGGLHQNISVVLLNYFSGLLLAWAYVAIYTVVTILIQNKAVVAVSCVILAFMLLLIGITIRLKIAEPVTFDASYYNEEIKNTEAEANPNYISGIKRDIYEFLNEFLPGGQSVELSGMTEKIAFSWHHPAYSIIIIIVTSCCGITIFRKKNLK